LLALATVDPGRGAGHLAWAKEATVTVSAGCSSALRINATAELLRAADISIATAVLLDSDENDETLGLLEPVISRIGRPLEVVPSSPASP
jgi:hypothetical protein